MKTLITPAVAEERLFRLRGKLPCVTMPLADAVGRVLREEIRADQDFPPFDRVMMDGIALRFADVEAGHRAFVITGMAPAGHSPQQLPEAKALALEVMTGAVLPLGSDCVVPVEWYESKNGQAIFRDGISPQAGVFIHKQGSDHRAGEVLLKAGVRVAAVETSVAAACGCATICVAQQPRIALVGTGDELVGIGEKPTLGKIRQTNVPTLAASLRLAGYSSLETAHAPDEAVALRKLLGRIFSGSDLVILTGGVSKGARDLVPDILLELSGEEVFHGISQRPGKPMAVWKVPSGPIVFGLPGNPVSALVCLHRYVLPALRHWSGEVVGTPLRRRLVGDFDRPEGLTLFLPVTDCGDGSVLALPTTNSGDFAGLLGSSGFVQVDERFAADSPAPYFPWNL